MLPEALTAGWRFWAVWFVAFLGFPFGGLAANLLVGPASTPLRAGLGGLLTGAIFGLVQWIALQGRVPVPASWIVATAIGLGAGLAIGVAVFGSEMGDAAFFGRAAIAGLAIGLAQWMLLRSVLPSTAIVWIGVVVVAWVAGWFMTRAVGVDLALKWTVFGAAGAVTHQLITGIALYALLQMAAAAK